MRAALALVAVALAGCPSGAGTGEAGPRETAGAVAIATVEDAFEACRAGDPAAGVARLDVLVAESGGAPDALVARGLCRWALWDETGRGEDARGAYRDLSAAIAAVERGAEAAGTPLHQIYGHRAFVAQAADGGWVRTLEDLTAALALAPSALQHRLDRGVVHAYAGDTLAARADLRAFLALSDSLAPVGDEQRRAVEALLLDLGDSLAVSGR